MTTRNPLVRINGKIVDLPASDDIGGALPGTDGAAATVTVGSTTTGAAGSSASVTNSGTSSAAILDFTIPSGADGAAGAAGANGTGSGANFICNGRLTLTSGTAVTTSDVTGATTIYFTPYGGNQVSTYDSSVWSGHTFTELSKALGTLTSGANYDVFIYNNSGALALELSSAWTSDTARNDALALQDGVYVKSADHSRRYVGTFRTTSTTATEDSAANRLVWNYYNRMERRGFVKSTSSHTYASSTVRYWNNSSANRVTFVLGAAEDGISVAMNDHILSGGSSISYQSGAALDSSTALTAGTDAIHYATLANGFRSEGASAASYQPSIGFHFVAALEAALSNSSGTYQQFTLSVNLRA